CTVHGSRLVLALRAKHAAAAADARRPQAAAALRTGFSPFPINGMEGLRVSRCSAGIEVIAAGRSPVSDRCVERFLKRVVESARFFLRNAAAGTRGTNRRLKKRFLRVDVP